MSKARVRIQTVLDFFFFFFFTACSVFEASLFAFKERIREKQSRDGKIQRVFVGKGSWEQSREELSYL